jgi:predicted ATPase
MRPGSQFAISLSVRADRLAGYLAGIPALLALAERPLALHPRVTFLVGENGSGKSTIVEALAIASGLNAEGGSARTRFTTHGSHSDLHRALVVERGPVPPLNGFFLRAESFYNFASTVHDAGGALRLENLYERKLHEQSHGESFLALALERFGPRGLYLLDEPEAALSVQGQLTFMRRMHDLVRQHSQFVVATHSPILLGYPDAAIVELGPDGIEEREWEDTDQVAMTRSFLEDRDRFLHHLLADDDED